MTTREPVNAATGDMLEEMKNAREQGCARGCFLATVRAGDFR